MNTVDHTELIHQLSTPMGQSGSRRKEKKIKGALWAIAILTYCFTLLRPFFPSLFRSLYLRYHLPFHSDLCRGGERERENVGRLLS
jgi:hypothetical protein